MKHFSHPHELFAAPMVSNHEIPCFGCKLPLFGGLYGCTGCNFYLHKFCFDLPQSIQWKSHTEHSLGLLYPPYCNGPCDACGESCKGFTYNCNLCDYNVHANCCTLLESEPKKDHDHEYFTTFLGFKLSKLKLLSATNDVGSSSANKHFSHPHTLNLLEPLGKDKYYDETMIITCSVCEKLIPVNSGAAYACPNRVCDFILHKSCFEIPRILNHKSHPNHPLGLLSEPPQYSLYYDCTACGDLINGFSYQCNECDDFRLHVKCTFLPDSVECKGHNKHPLVLLYCTPPKGFNIVSCGVCDDGITGGCWSYYCKDCDFVTDLNCAFSAEVEPPADDEEEEKDNDEEEEAEAENEEENGEEEEEEEEEEELSDAMRLMRANIKAMDQMARLNFQMQMAQLNARTIANIWH